MADRHHNLYFISEPGRLEPSIDGGDGSCTHIGTYDNIETAKAAFKQHLTTHLATFEVGFIQNDGDFQDLNTKQHFWWMHEIFDKFPILLGQQLKHFWGYRLKNGYIAPWYGIVI